MKVENSDWGMAAFFLMLALLDNMTQRGLSTDENNQRIFQEAIEMSENKALQQQHSALMRGADVLHAVWHMSEKVLKNRGG